MKIRIKCTIGLTLVLLWLWHIVWQATVSKTTNTLTKEEELDLACEILLLLLRWDNNERKVNEKKTQYVAYHELLNPQF